MSRPKGLPKTGGRAKGVQNVTTRTVKETMQCVWDEKITGLDKIWEELTPAEQIKFLVELAKFLVPRPQSISIENNVEEIADIVRAKMPFKKPPEPDAK